MVTVCNNGTYGFDCAYNCSGHCLHNSPCNKTTGNCEGGCEPGYTDENCRKGEFLINLII